MEAIYPQIPEKYRLVRGYSKAHRRLFGYLFVRQNLYVSVDELRLLTGDAVHTERRLRELRDLGIVIDMSESDGHRGCRLSLPDSLTAVARSWIVRQVGADKSLDEEKRRQLLLEL